MWSLVVVVELYAGQHGGLVDGGAGDAGGDPVPLRPAVVLAVLLVGLSPDHPDVVAHNLVTKLALARLSAHCTEYLPVLGGVEPKP